MIRTLLLLTVLLCTGTSIAGGVYQEPKAFIADVFGNEVPKPEVIWPDKALKQTLTDILGHAYTSLRIRYWRRDTTTAWVLDEIGKEKPITTGIVIKDGKVERVRILVFRESRGWEVRHAFFTEQFDQARLQPDLELDRHIDNISGATLSVNAVSKLVRVALALNQRVISHPATP
jgi:Na+-translocating ferredoxin:NAD+ oxidoreductase RnfG subunit